VGLMADENGVGGERVDAHIAEIHNVALVIIGRHLLLVPHRNLATIRPVNDQPVCGNTRVSVWMQVWKRARYRMHTKQWLLEKRGENRHSLA
jgi:hypothetical protein